MPGVVTRSSRRDNTRPGTFQLVAAGSGTAMASVCAIGLFQIEQLAGGVWSIMAILLAAGLCAFLTRVFSRLTEVVPSGAGLIAFISRAYHRQAGIAVVVPYVFMMLFLVGFEALIVGGLLEYLSGLPSIIGACLFIVLTWLVCRAGLRPGYQTQFWTTAALFFGLVGLSVLVLLKSLDSGLLANSLFPGFPRSDQFITATGQALFLFLGFELLTSHVEVATPARISRSLSFSVVVLFVFYTMLSLGFSCLENTAVPKSGELFIPQLAIAAESGGAIMVTGIAIVCLLASFTSFNGALLALSRFIYALAAQGTLPKYFARLDHRSLTAKPALNLLLIAALFSTCMMASFRLFELAILAAAVTVSWVYAISVLARERPPFTKADEGRRYYPWLIAVLLLGLGLAVIISAGRFQFHLILFLLCSYGAGLAMAWYSLRCQQAKDSARPALRPVQSASTHEREYVT